MCVKTKRNKIKSKNFIEIDDIKKNIKEGERFEINVYFESLIEETEVDKDYIIPCIGGLYNIVDLYLYVENNEETYENEKYIENGELKPQNYRNENLKEYALETAKTAKELIKIKNRA